MYFQGLLRVSIPFFLTIINHLSGNLEITNITPSSGNIGENITIEGTDLENISKVFFDENEAEFHADSKSSLRAIVPQGSGHTQVTVQSKDQTSQKTFSTFYTYEGTGKAFVVNHGSGSITPIDLATNTPLEAIHINGNPGTIAITPDGKKAYITDDLLNEVVPFDIINNTLGTPISVGPLPYSIAITPNGEKAYVANHMANSVTPIDLTKNCAGKPIPMGNLPFGIAISPDGKTAYVTNSGSNTVTPIDIATDTPQSSIPVGVFPFNIAITPDGRMAYVTNTGSNSVTPIDLQSGMPRAPISVGVNPAGIAIVPNGSMAYVVNAGSNNISPIDLVLNVSLPAIAVGNTPAEIAITPDGKTAIITNQNSNNITLIDLIQNTTRMVIPVGSVPFGIAITPDQAPLASFKASKAALGAATIFDASASKTPHGKITRYDWDFGDGHKIFCEEPTVSHIYAAEGPYTVTLTVTNSAGTSINKIFTGQTVSNNGDETARMTQLITLKSKAPEPPTQFSGYVTKKKRFNGTECTNHLSWNPSEDDSVIGYYLLRDGEFIAEIKAETGEFLDKKRKNNKRHVYTLTAFNNKGELSSPVFLILP